MSHATASRGLQLDRGLTLIPATAVIMANVIGTGVFMKARVMTANVGSPGLVLTAYIAAGLLALAGCLVLGELAAMMPRSGGAFNFLGAAYGRRWAFLYAWTQGLAVGAGVAAVAILTVTFLNDATGGALSPFQLRALPVAVIGVGAGLNLLSVRATGGVATCLTGIKIGLVLTIAFGAFALSDGSFDHFGMSGAAGAAHGVPEASRLGLGGFGAAMAGALWSYNGWAIITTVGGEVRDPGRILPKAMVLSTLLVLVLYLFINASYFFAMTPLEITDLPEHVSVAGSTVERFAGAGLTSLLTTGLVISAYGTLHTSLLTGSRIPFAMATRGLAPASFRKLNRRQVPSTAVIALALWASALVLTGTFDSLTDVTIFLVWVFVGLTGTAVFRLRRRFPDAPRPYRVFGFPVVPVLFLLATGFMLASMLISTPMRCLAGSAMIITGVPVYAFFRRHAPKLEGEAWFGEE